MDLSPRLLGPDGQPHVRPTTASLKTASLKAEIARPMFGSVRSPVTGYPADGLTPARLGAILREADAGEPVRYLELLEFAEERDPHYAGVMATRRRSVTQLPILVEPASDAPEDEADAETVRAWLKRDELADELFDILDCLPKGFSFTEIVWDNPGGVWEPARLVRRDPRWFRFARDDLETPVMLADSGAELALPPAKFVHARIGAKSGLPLRAGLGRIALWSYLFKKFTERDAQIFIQTYGQPLRVGKFGPGASEADKDTLFRAVANIAGDCAAIIPEAMTIEFIQSGQLSATGGLYTDRLNWIDQQVSKLVLGQTATTDAVTGGLGSGKEHRQVQEDIERADARALAAILNRDLIRPWFRLNRGAAFNRFPRLKIERPEEEDLKALAEALSPFIDRGLRVPENWVRDKFGVPEPQGDEAVLGPAAGPDSGPDSGGDTPPGDPAPDPAAAGRALKRKRAVFKGGAPLARGKTAPEAEGAPRGKNRGVLTMAAEGPVGAPDLMALLADRMAVEAGDAVGSMMLKVEAMVDAAGSMEELSAMLVAGFGEVDDAALRAALGRGFVAAFLAGRAAAEGDSAGG